MKVWMRPDLAGFTASERTRDVLVEGPAEASDGRLLDGLRHGSHGVEIPVRRRRESSLDHIDAHALELARDAQFFFLGHRGAGTLLAIPQGGIENDQMFLGHACLLGEKCR
jgi:hypothetical protein